ncbi:MAG: hypothetical protein DHS20C05_18110 [Hyphococcus sp.]|nr:MAG: hypothetical protein DHS20C05_18110 [Marinicaulis sp.]
MSEQVKSLEANYLIVGSGAVGMAFADVLLTETDARMIIVDMHHKPGGHWNVAYPFVTLHQPSSFYGVSSKELSKSRVDQVGLNKGLGDLATGPEVMSYFDEVMRHQFLPSGRVQYYPMCEYDGDGAFHSLTSGEKFHATAIKKTVDATYLKTTVPSTHTPNFDIAKGVNFIALNDLPKVSTPPSNYVVVGGGKTGIDACLWLLENQVDPDKIQWVMSRDAWLLNRKNTQASDEFFNDAMGAQAAQMEAIANATSIDDLFDRLEAAGVFVRIDETVRPKMFHGATISELELAELRRIKNIIRLGRVKSIETDRMVLDQGDVKTDANTLFVDCSASAISNLEMKPIFDGNLITPQTVRSYQPVFSAAFIAHVEAAYDNEAEKNEICTVVPLPNHDTDWIRFTAAFMQNQYRWSQNKELRAWLLNNRLDGFSRMVANIGDDDHDKKAIMQRIRDSAMPAMGKLQQFLAELN